MEGKRNSRRAVISVLVVFVLGLVLGALGGPMVIEKVRGEGRNGRHEGPRKNRAQLIQDLTTDVGLTAEQQEQLKVVFAEADAKYKAMYEQTKPQMDAIKQEGRAKIRQMLTAEQAGRYDAFLQRLDEERRRNEEERKRRPKP